MYLVAVVEVVDAATANDERWLAFCSEFAAALAEFQKRRWLEAGKRFRTCLVTAPEDGPCRLYIRLCAQYQQYPPPGSWRGMIEVSKEGRASEESPPLVTDTDIATIR